MSGEWSQTPLIPPETQVQVWTRILLHSFDPATHVTARMAPRAKQESGTPQKEHAVLSKHHNLQLLVTMNVLNVGPKGPQSLENNKNRHVDSFLCVYVFSLHTYIHTGNSFCTMQTRLPISGLFLIPASSGCCCLQFVAQWPWGHGFDSRCLRSACLKCLWARCWSPDLTWSCICFV